MGFRSRKGAGTFRATIELKAGIRALESGTGGRTSLDTPIRLITPPANAEAVLTYRRRMSSGQAEVV